VTLTVISI